MSMLEPRGDYRVIKNLGTSENWTLHISSLKSSAIRFFHFMEIFTSEHERTEFVIG